MCEHEHVAGNNLVRIDLPMSAFADHDRLKDEEFIQRLQFFLRAVLFKKAQEHAQCDDAQDKKGRHAAATFAGQKAHGIGERCREQEHHDKEIGKLFQEQSHGRDGLAPRDLVTAQAGQTLTRLG